MRMRSVLQAPFAAGALHALRLTKIQVVFGNVVHPDPRPSAQETHGSFRDELFSALCFKQKTSVHWALPSSCHALENHIQQSWKAPVSVQLPHETAELHPPPDGHRASTDPSGQRTVAHVTRELGLAHNHSQQTDLEALRASCSLEIIHQRYAATTSKPSLPTTNFRTHDSAAARTD